MSNDMFDKMYGGEHVLGERRIRDVPHQHRCHTCGVMWDTCMNKHCEDLETAWCGRCHQCPRCKLVFEKP